MSLRQSVFEIIKENKETSSLESISEKIYDYLDGESLGIYGNGWADEPGDLADIINTSTDHTMMMSAVRILNGLDDCGLGLNANGWFDDDSDWNHYLAEFFTEDHI